MTSDFSVSCVLDRENEFGRRNVFLGALKPVPDLRLRRANAISEGFLTTHHIDGALQGFGAHGTKDLPIFRLASTDKSVSAQAYQKIGSHLVMSIVGGRIAKRLTVLGKSQVWLAKQVGMKQQSINSIIVGDVERPKKLREIAAALDTTQEYLLGETDSPGLSGLKAAGGAVQSPRQRVLSVPLVSWISAGKMAGSEVPPNVRAERRIAVADLPHGEWIALRVQGDSMNLIAPEEAIIFVDVSDKRLSEDRFYVFRQENGDATFKRYRGGRQPRLQPYSTNPDHETIIPQDDVVVVGRVRRVVNELG